MDNEIDSVDLDFDVGGSDTNTTADTIAEDFYLAKIGKIKHHEAEGNKSAYLSVPLEIVSARKPENEKFVGKTLWDNLWLSSKAAFRLANFHASCGYKSKVKKLVFDDYRNKLVAIKVKQEEYNGVTRAKVMVYLTEEEFKKMTVATFTGKNHVAKHDDEVSI